jgi:hypothetical protein
VRGRARRFSQEDGKDSVTPKGGAAHNMHGGLMANFKLTSSDGDGREGGQARRKSPADPQQTPSPIREQIP